MQKYLIVLFISFILFQSCGYSCLDTSQPAIVDKIESRGDGTCFYYGPAKHSPSIFIASLQFVIIDSIGKFNVGDTIKLNK